jgi:hypothetical protein
LWAESTIGRANLIDLLRIEFFQLRVHAWKRPPPLVRPRHEGRGSNTRMMCGAELSTSPVVEPLEQDLLMLGVEGIDLTAGGFAEPGQA